MVHISISSWFDAASRWGWTNEGDISALMVCKRELLWGLHRTTSVQGFLWKLGKLINCSIHFPYYIFLPASSLWHTTYGRKWWYLSSEVALLKKFPPHQSLSKDCLYFINTHRERNISSGATLLPSSPSNMKEDGTSIGQSPIMNSPSTMTVVSSSSVKLVSSLAPSWDSLRCRRPYVRKS